MQIQRVQNNSYNTKFGAKYIIKGTSQESTAFIDKLGKSFPCEITHTHLKLSGTPDSEAMLICTDNYSEKAVFSCACCV